MIANKFAAARKITADGGGKTCASADTMKFIRRDRAAPQTNSPFSPRWLSLSQVSAQVIPDGHLTTP